jgi:hypothetical protein
MTQPSDLAIRFGTQTRLKCVDCRKYMSSDILPVKHCKCGTVWTQVEGTKYERLHREKLV